MSSLSLRRLSPFAWIIAAALLTGCPGPGTRPDEGDRRGPPPFSELDLDRDGQLTLDEFKRHKIPRGDHTEVFDSIDSNGDGIVTESELTSHRPPERPARPEQDQ